MTTSNVAILLPPWHAAYPTPRTTPAIIRREDVLDMIKQSAETSSRDYILIDLRRNDYEVRKIDHFHTLLWKGLSKAGRYHLRFNQPSCAEFVPYHPDSVHALQGRRHL